MNQLLLYDKSNSIYLYDYKSSSKYYDDSLKTLVKKDLFSAKQTGSLQKGPSIIYFTCIMLTVFSRNTDSISSIGTNIPPTAWLRTIVCPSGAYIINDVLNQVNISII